MRAFHLGLPKRLPRPYAEPFGLVVFGQHDAVPFLYVSPDRYCLSAQFGTVEAFDRGVKIVHVAM